MLPIDNNFRCATLQGFFVVLLWLSVISPSQAEAFLSLRDCIAQALQSNHEQLALTDQVELAELDYVNARAAYKTKFLATSRSDARSGAELGSYTGVYLRKQNLSGSALSAGLYNSDFGDKSLSELRFSYTLPFFRDPFTDGQLALTRADTAYVRRQNLLEIAKQELSKQVTASYYYLILAQDRERIAGMQRDIAGQIKEATRIKHNSGKVSEVDYSRAELRYMAAEQSFEVASFQRTQAEDNLRLLIGLEFDREFSIDPNPDVDFDESLFQRPLAVLEENAITNRVELRGKRDELNIAGKKMSNVSENKLPAIDIDVHYSLVGEGDSTSDSFDLDEQKWGVGFKMDTDFGGTERKNKRRKLYLIYQSHQRELEHLTQQVKLSVRAARFDALRNSRMLELIKREYVIAQRQHEQSRILHENDQLNKVELLESEHNLHEVEHRQLAARVNYILANMELGLASGQYALHESTH